MNKKVQEKALTSLLEKYSGKKVILETYEPYTGGAGPTPEQVSANTKSLFRILQKQGVNCTMDNGEYAAEHWNGDEKMIVITKPKGQTIHVSYDRWGFCVDADSDIKGVSDIDQEGLKETCDAICKWYKGSSNLAEATDIDYSKDDLSYNKDNKTFTGSEKKVRFDTTYIVRSPKGGSKEFKFSHSTGPEFDPNAKWIYKSDDGFTLEICNDAAITKKNADNYLAGKLRKESKKGKNLKEATEITKSISIDLVDSDNQIESLLKYIRKALAAGQNAQVSISTDSDSKQFMIQSSSSITSLGIDETIDTVDEEI